LSDRDGIDHLVRRGVTRAYAGETKRRGRAIGRERNIEPSEGDRGCRERSGLGRSESLSTQYRAAVPEYFHFDLQRRGTSCAFSENACVESH
jgi:hypothetical protein